MKLLFVSQAARIIYDDDGNAYLNNHMNRKTIQRYVGHCDELTMFLRDSGIRLPVQEAMQKYNPFPHDLARLVTSFNPYVPLSNYLRLDKRTELKRRLTEEIQAADRVIMSAAFGFYIEIAIRFCKRYQKPYMLLCGGFTFETIWNNTNPLGKVMAPLEEFRCRRNLAQASYALYVTEYALQKRYLCRGKCVGCSDVEVPALEPEVLEQRLRRIAALDGDRPADAEPAPETAADPADTSRKGHRPLSADAEPVPGTAGDLTDTTLKGHRPLRAGAKLVLGTAAGLADARKGQRHVIRAIAKLKEQGISNIEYQLIGGGSPDKLAEEAKRQGVEDQVKILGSKPHEEVYAWLDQIDVYIQPSFSEGLCRAIVEAMSRACPVLSSDAGGNVELCDEEFLFKAGHVDQIARQIQKMLDPSLMERAARENFERAKRYETKRLDSIRNAFLAEFMK